MVLDPDIDAGLTSDEAARRLLEVGPNLLPDAKRLTVWGVALRQLQDPFIYILMAAAVLSFTLGHHSSTAFILFAIFVDALIGTIQEYSAQHAALALRNLTRGSALVVRDGAQRRIPIEDVVPGDVVVLSSGDKVPADMMLVSAQNLAVDESLLTGESLPVDKAAEASCFAGTIVVRGRGRGVVRETGGRSALGKIAAHVVRTEETDPPLLVRMRRFTVAMSVVIFGLVALLLAIMALHGGYDPYEMTLMAIGLAVSAIPEGLPASITVALAVGMHRMAQHHVIIRKMAAVEALGSCTLICSDKTGTLTVNELTIRKIVLPDGTSFDVGGEGFRRGGEIVGTGDVDLIRDLCLAGICANEASLEESGDRQSWIPHGDAVDAAFLVLAHKAGMSFRQVREDSKRIGHVPYESEHAYSASLNQHEAGEVVLHVKGSPETLLPLCRGMVGSQGEIPLDADGIVRQVEDLARAGYRVLALAARAADPDVVAFDQVRDLVLLGLVGMMDPLRPEAREAVRDCHSARVDVAMVTGDHPETARTLARELGLIGDDGSVVTGAQLREAPLAAQAEMIRSARVFARIEPQQKSQIVQTFMQDGHFVAVTGDGVNDAPALRQAHVGIAMGARGTDVARESSQLIITDDNFASIVAGVREGRIVYANIRKVVLFLMSNACANILLFFLSSLAGMPMPMTAVQLLWLNLVADGLQDVCLALEKGEGDELRKPPRPPAEPLLERRLLFGIIVYGLTMGWLAFFLFQMVLSSGAGAAAAQNAVLLLMVIFGNVQVMNARSETRSFLGQSPFGNGWLLASAVGTFTLHLAAMWTPGLSDVLGVSPVSVEVWERIGVSVMVLVGVMEGYKWVLRRFFPPDVAV